MGGRKRKRVVQRPDDQEACKCLKFSVKCCPLVPSCGPRATPHAQEAKLFPPRCNPASRHPGLKHRDLPSEDNAEAYQADIVYQDIRGLIPYLRSLEQTRPACWGEAPAQHSPGTLWSCLSRLNRNQAAKLAQGMSKETVQISTYSCARGFLPSLQTHTSL